MAMDQTNDVSEKNGNSEVNGGNDADGKKVLHVAAPLARELSDFEKNLTPTAKAMLEAANQKRNTLGKMSLREFSLSIIMHPFWLTFFSILGVAFAIFVFAAQVTIQSEIAQPYHMDDVYGNTYVESMSDEVAAMHMNFTAVVNLRANSLLSSLDLRKRQSNSCTFWSCTRSHLDVPRLLEGNVGITMMGAVTKLPYTINQDQECGDTRIFCGPRIDRNLLINSLEMMSFLSFVSGWNWRSWMSPFRRALHQAEKVFEIVQTEGETSTSPGVLITDTDSLGAFMKAKGMCRAWRVMPAEEKLVFEKKAWELGMRNRNSLINRKITIEKIMSMTLTDDDTESTSEMEEERYDFQKWCSFVGFILVRNTVHASRPLPALPFAYMCVCAPIHENTTKATD